MKKGKKRYFLLVIIMTATLVFAGCSSSQHRVEESLAELPERHYQARPSMAVLPFRNDSGEQIIHHGEKVSSRMRSTLIETDRFQVKPEGETMEVLSEASLPNISPAEALRVAENLDVSYILMGNVIRVDIEETSSSTSVEAVLEVQLLDLVSQQVTDTYQGQGYAREKAVGDVILRDLVWTAREEALIRLVNQITYYY